MVHIQAASKLALLALALPLLFSSPAQAANPAKQAQKLLQKRANAVLDDFENKAKLRQKLLDTELDSLEQMINAGNGSTGSAVTLFAALQDFQVAMRDEINEASDEYRVGMGEALIILQGASISTADRPTGFFFGDQGTTDKLSDDMAKTIVKVYEKVEKRLNKLSALLRKKANIALTYRLSAPTSYFEWITSPGGSGSKFFPTQITADIAIGVSDKDLAGDADFYLAGSCESDDGTLASSIASAGFGGVLSSVPTSNDRWELVVLDRNEGNYQFKVHHTGLVAGAGYVAIGVD